MLSLREGEDDAPPPSVHCNSEGASAGEPRKRLVSGATQRNIGHIEKERDYPTQTTRSLMDQLPRVGSNSTARSCQGLEGPQPAHRRLDRVAHLPRSHRPLAGAATALHPS